jgi:putative transcription factor
MVNNILPCYCEICGREIPDERMCKTVVIDNAVLRVCPQCYQRLMRQGRIKEVVEREPARRRVRPRTTWSRANIPRRILEESYEVVEDYAERIRRARQRLGWTQAALAQRVREKENVIKRIEAGRLKPSIALARKLERVLGITLLEPIVEESTYSTSKSGEEDYYTIGDFIKIKKK